MKIIALSFITVIPIILSISFAKAWWGYTGPEFIPLNGQMCRYKDPTENTVTKYTQEDCLEWSDPATFGKFRKWKLLFGKHMWGNVYADKNALYYFPVNGEWERIELDVKSISKTGRNYFYASNALYYNWLPLSDIIKVTEDLIWIWRYLDDDTLITSHPETGKSEFYYRWILDLSIDANKLEHDTVNYFESKGQLSLINYPFFVSWYTVYMPDTFELHKIEWVDLKTFRKNGWFWYQDKNNFYRFVYWHYGFEIVIKSKKR